tara:strand:+ start:615 stop:839 length:225 start_codon:yes stop_codon:yes gene_type:complete
MESLNVERLNEFMNKEEVIKLINILKNTDLEKIDQILMNLIENEEPEKILKLTEENEEMRLLFKLLMFLNSNQP